MFTKIYWRIRIVALSFRWIPALNIGDEVIWNGKRCVLVQGVCAPSWDLMHGQKRFNHVSEKEFRKVKSITNWWRSFRSGYDFYMTYWYTIWCKEGIQPWMLGCNIWKKGEK